MRGKALDNGLGEKLNKWECQEGEGGEGVGAQPPAWERDWQVSGIIPHRSLYICM